MYQLTHPDEKFAIETADRINKNYPDGARVIDNCCMITDTYWAYCKEYVSKKCNIKKYEVDIK